MASAKVVVVLGSPRKQGNSTLLAEAALRGARSAGASCVSFALQSMRIEPCRACDSCMRPKGAGCAIKDDMQSLYPPLRAAESILLASPVYWFSISAQMKLFLDRCYALHVEGGHVFNGKRFGLLLSYGDEDAFASGGINAIRMMQDACRYLRAELVDVVHASAGPAGAVAANSAVLERAAELGRRLALSEPATSR